MSTRGSQRCILRFTVTTQKQRNARAQLISDGILLVGGAIVATHFGQIQGGGVHNKVIAIVGVLAFLVFSVLFLHVLTSSIKNFLAVRRFGASRAASIRYALRIFGYIIIFFITLSLLHIPVGKLLLGSAVVGIILGVAAQQALSNFFASIILILSHPFSVGEAVVINSGALGGRYEGTIKDIGLTHTSIRESDGTVVLLPNAAMLSGSAIRRQKSHPPSDR